MIRWSPKSGRYESECGRFLVFAEGRDWLGVDAVVFEQSPGFSLPDAARAWCEARKQGESNGESMASRSGLG